MRFDRFIKKITNYEYTSLLSALAREGAEQTLRHRNSGPHDYYDGRTGMTPWALIEIAREAIVNAQLHGRRPSAEDVRRLCFQYTELDDPLATSPNASIDQFMVRTAFEQFRWGISEFEELSRSRGLFVEAAAKVPSATAFSEAAWRASTGYSVGETVDVGFFLLVMATRGVGRVDLALLDDPAYEPLFETLPRDQIYGVVRDLLSATPGELAAMDSSKSIPDNVKEHRFNPLTARPIVRLPTNQLLSPHPLLLLQRVSPTGLYYDRHRDPGFTDQLGPVFEHYVGMHLDLISGATVHREIDLGTKGKSVDFIIVLPSVTVLVEVKATRLTEEARAGLPRLDDDRDRTLTKAQSQINRTHLLAVGGHPALDFIPKDRPVRGLIITLEPYWLALFGFGFKLGGPVVSHIAAMRELESFCGTAQHRDVSELILGMPTNHSNNALASAVGDDKSRNPILDRNFVRTLEDRT